MAGAIGSIGTGGISTGSGTPEGAAYYDAGLGKFMEYYGGEWGVAGSTTPDPAAGGWEGGTYAPPTTSGSTGSSGGSTGGSSGGLASLTGQAYDANLTGLREIRGEQEDNEKAAISKIGGLYDTNFASLGGARDMGLGRVDLARSQADSQLAQGQRRIGATGRQALQSFNNQLGTFGAGSSSAANLGSEAIGRDIQRTRSDLFQSGQERYAGLDLTEGEIGTNYQLQLGELNNWKAQSITDIGREYDQIISAIDREIANAPLEKQLALLEIRGQYATQASTAIEGVTNQANELSSNLGVFDINVDQGAGIMQPNLSDISGGINVLNGNAPGKPQGIASFGIPNKKKESSGISGLLNNPQF